MKPALFALSVFLASQPVMAQPTITQPPANQTVALGGTLTLGVTAGGTAPAYQWFKDSRLILGATNSTLTIPNAGVTNSGTYYVVVTNTGGMVISLPALVAVGNPTLLGWGYNKDGELGNGTTISTNRPIVVASNAVVAAGGDHSLFVMADGTLWTMGFNNYGQLGNGTTTEANTPINVASNAVAGAAGVSHSLFVTADGRLWAMGWNAVGELGNGTTSNTNRPVCVASNVMAVAAGFVHSLFVKTDGTLWAMGHNGYGQLGNGTTSNTNRPVIVASNVVAVAAGEYHSLFVTADGTLWAMGWNTYGQLGNGTKINTNRPVNVASNVVAVAAGDQHSLFVTVDGTLWAMGYNNYGQLGNGTTNNTNLPVNVASNAVVVAAGYEHSLFVKTDGTPWAMGYNGDGELGNGTTISTNLPVCVPHLLSVANVFPADEAFHSLAIGFLQASAIVTLGNLNQIYTGSAIGVTASTTPPGLTVNVTYNGSSSAPTNAGRYTVLGTISDPNYYGSATNTLVINPSAVTVTLGNLNQAYTGSAISVTANTTPPDLTVSLTYNGSPNAPTNAGSYTVIGTINNLNYVGSATNTLVINPSAATVTLGNLNQIYTGSAISVMASTTPPSLTVKLTYNGSTNAPTNPGSYTVIGTITTPNYVGGATNTLVITPLTVTPASQVVAVGGTVTLGVTVSITAPAYQWFKESRLIVGATNNTFTVMNAGVTNSGTYYVVVTNTGGMFISPPASVAVGNPSLLVWGYNNRGQLGNGMTINTNQPVSLASNVVAGAAGYIHSLFVTADGTLWAMGFNGYGELGNGTTSDARTPVNVASNVVAVAAGEYHSLFLKTNGTLWAMGLNESGQLGNGSYNGTNPNTVPINVASNVVAVAAGAFHSLFLKMDGTLWAMGNNHSGELGNGTNSGIYANPTPICVANNVVAVAAGAGHSLFVKADGTLWTMGFNHYGQLGIGTTNETDTPINVASNVVAVAAGDEHSLFVTADGTLWTMGWNAYGQLGNGTTNNALTPTSVASNVVAVAAGEEHSLFVTADGTLWAMGWNAYGQLGIGTTNSTSLPVSVPHMPVANVFPADDAYHSMAIGINYNATVTLGDLNQLYTGSAISVTASTTPPGLTVNLTYNGSPNAPTNAGSYTVIGTISDPNYYGIATNTLVVGLPPQSFAASTSSTNSQQLMLQLTGTPGYPYILQSATNLTPPIVWQSIFTNHADTNGNWSFAVTNMTIMPEGFYRVMGQ